MERFIEELKELIALRDKVDDGLKPSIDSAIRLLIEDHVRRNARPINYPPVPQNPPWWQGPIVTC